MTILNSLSTDMSEKDREKALNSLSILSLMPDGSVKIKDDVINKIKEGDDGSPNVLYIDEYTWINAIDYQILTEWANKNNVVLALLGDDYQNKSKMRNQN